MRSVQVQANPASPIQIARHAGPLAALQADWAQLIDANHPGAVFRSYPWISSWWNEFSSAGEAHVLVARRGADVVGILPLYAERTTLGGRRLRLMGDGIVGSDWLGPVTRDPAVARAFADALMAEGVDELQLDDLSDDDALIDALRQRTLPPAACEIEPRYRCPFIRTEGAFEDYLRTLPDGTGQQYHRRRKWLEKREGYRFEELRTPDDVVRGMEILWNLHRERWALEGGSDAIDGPQTERFHLAAARALAEAGIARVWLLHVEGAPRAALYGWRIGNRLAYYQAGHEVAWRPRSVGTVLLGQIIKGCFDEGLTEFDFLRGEEPYKLKWATGFRHTVRANVRSAGLRPWLTHEARTRWKALRT